MSRCLTASLAALGACAPADRLEPVARSPHELTARFASCESPEPFAGRFMDSASARGITRPLQATPTAAYYHGPQTGVIADDIDLDGDIDLLFWDGSQQLHLYWNDGRGDFEAGTLPPPPDLGPHHFLRVAGAGDIDGDGRLDLVWAGDGVALWSINVGDQAFAPWQVAIADDEAVLAGYASAAFGDVDDDGDLDVMLAGLDQRPAGEPLPSAAEAWTASPDRLLVNEGGQLVAGAVLVQSEGPTMSLIQTFTDRDLDGDADLLSWADRADAIEGCPGAAFWRNDGGNLVNDAPSLAADTRASAMGLGSADFNRDGLLDYCVTDIADRLTCLMSDGRGGYYEGAAAMGLTLDRGQHPDWRPSDATWSVYVGWGLTMVDLDNDGLEDAAATGSIVSTRLDLDQPDVDSFQPHWLWRGTSAGQFETDLTTGFESSTRWAWGMASADLDGDGSRELITAPAHGLPEVWDNPCTAGAALEVELAMEGSNRHAVGATVAVSAGGTTWRQQVGSAAAGGQSPARLHFGLGTQAAAATVEVLWPGGERTVTAGVPANSRVRIRP